MNKVQKIIQELEALRDHKWSMADYYRFSAKRGDKKRSREYEQEWLTLLTVVSRVKGIANQP